MHEFLHIKNRHYSIFYAVIHKIKMLDNHILALKMNYNAFTICSLNCIRLLRVVERRKRLEAIG